MAVQEIHERTTCTLPRRTSSSFSEGGLLNPSLDSNSGGGMWWHLAPMPALSMGMKEAFHGETRCCVLMLNVAANGIVPSVLVLALCTVNSMVKALYTQWFAQA